MIKNANIPNLKISVGSEMSMMLKPNVFWVTNVRTLWSYLALKHDWNIDVVNNALDLYKDNERDSEMEYAIWSDLHPLLGDSLKALADLGTKETLKQDLEPGKHTFLWADAFANELYSKYSR